MRSKASINSTFLEGGDEKRYCTYKFAGQEFELRSETRREFGIVDFFFLSHLLYHELKEKTGLTTGATFA